ncbi:MAG: hypothetical protein ACRDVG_04210 [Jatrophihabitantaceae bacterium]
MSAPTTSVRASFQEAMAEFAAEGRGERYEAMVGADLRDQAAAWRATEGFAEYVAVLRAEALEETPRRSGWVPCTTWWWVEGETWLGRIALRHRLTRRTRLNWICRRRPECAAGRAYRRG